MPCTTAWSVCRRLSPMSEHLDERPHACLARLNEYAVRLLKTMLDDAHTVAAVNEAWAWMRPSYFSCEPHTQRTMLRLRGDALERIALKVQSNGPMHNGEGQRHDG